MKQNLKEKVGEFLFLGKKLVLRHKKAQWVKLGFLKLHKKMVPRRGFEPRTQGFSVPCSTD